MQGHHRSPDRQPARQPRPEFLHRYTEGFREFTKGPSLGSAVSFEQHGDGGLSDADPLCQLNLGELAFGQQPFQSFGKGTFGFFQLRRNSRCAGLNRSSWPTSGPAWVVTLADRSSLANICSARSRSVPEVWGSLHRQKLWQVLVGLVEYFP